MEDRETVPLSFHPISQEENCCAAQNMASGAVYISNGCFHRVMRMNLTQLEPKNRIGNWVINESCVSEVKILGRRCRLNIYTLDLKNKKVNISYNFLI